MRTRDRIFVGRVTVQDLDTGALCSAFGGGTVGGVDFQTCLGTRCLIGTCDDVEHAGLLRVEADVNLEKVSPRARAASMGFRRVRVDFGASKA
jgi:hypothetical protein